MKGVKDNLPKASHKVILTDKRFFEDSDYEAFLVRLWHDKIRSKISEVLLPD